MADPDMEEEDLFADLYDGDEAAGPKDPAPVPIQASVPEPSNTASAPGYGEEPEYEHDPTSFEAEMTGAEISGNGANGDYPDQQEMANTPEPGIRMKDDGKMFIGGLNWETTDQSLHDYFSQFGEVQECTVMRDGATGRSRGFGFLTFKDPKTVNTVMVKEHFLDGKIIDPKRAIPKDEQEKTAKIFVGGVSQDATETDFTSFFAQFGRVIDATLMMDKDTGRPRGFGFVTFDNDAAVERCLDYHPLEILGKPIEVKRAQPRGKIGEEEEFSRGGGRGRGGKFGGREDRFADSQPSQNQSQAPGNQGMNGMSPQMMAQYWQRMQQYFAMMQQQMMSNAMGGMNMGQMNPQMMAQMQQMQQMQNMQNKMGGGNSPGSQGMNPQMQQQMMQMMMNQGGMNGMGGAGGQGQQQQRPPSGPMGMGNNRNEFSAQEQIAFEQQKYEQQARRSNAPSGPRGTQQGPQSWEGMYDDVPQPEGSQGGQGGRGGGMARHNSKPGKSTTPTQPSNAPANAPTGPKNPGVKPGGGFRGGRGHGRYHPYGR